MTDAIVADIRQQHRVRCFAMEQRKRMDLSLLAFLRVQLGWRRDLPDEDRKRIAEQAKALVARGESAVRGRATEIDEAAWADWQDVIAAALAARAPFDRIESNATKQMERLAKSLPVWPWCEEPERRGLGAVSLAVIVGEAGDIGSYRDKGCLWKRMGLAPFRKNGDVRACSTWGRYGGLTAEEWTWAGYSPVRRSRMFVIGDVLVKQGTHYRAVYLRRKDYERTRAVSHGLIVAPSASIPKARADEFISDGHIHRRAQRYMEKILLRDLRVAWRRANACALHEATVASPAAESLAGEDGAADAVPKKAIHQSPLPTGTPHPDHGATT